MSFNDDVQINPGRVSDQRGGGGGRGGLVLGGGGGILALILALVFGPGVLEGGSEDPTSPGTSSQVQASQGAAESAQCTTGTSANSDDGCRLIATVESLDEFWKAELPQNGVRFRQPEVQMYSGRTNTGCGQGTSATGPFYCPTDQTAYVDTTFYKEFTSQFGGSSGPLAQMYIVAHEYGHHIQNLMGDLKQSQFDPQGATSGAVRTELQADCYAGLWAGHAATTKDPESGKSFLKPITEAQIGDALAAAESVGDDHIQSTASGRVNPDAWTHGSSAQRKAWFMQGYNAQSMRSCDTFSARDLNNPGS
ncbi:neutral zinc metallopeptidase [Falsarthrobacter nasiphocae]|uniref:Metalloprotease n=1 Tax=Falsarthrobacter nasiphocae TaxID=189863 RepID=A0AAE4C5J8_9MICC|nr:neutral zinc metallopeptidase [Falsarthrobacter nasiphocae]MDR6891142.1 putative metalloprotease [Falsarthrobacter nasiphocae]